MNLFLSLLVLLNPPLNAAEPMPYRLLGTISSIDGSASGVAVLLEIASGKTLSLQVGESHRGFVLTKVENRSAWLQAGNQIFLVEYSPFVETPKIQDIDEDLIQRLSSLRLYHPRLNLEDAEDLFQ